MLRTIIIIAIIMSFSCTITCAEVNLRGRTKAEIAEIIAYAEEFDVTIEEADRALDKIALEEAFAYEFDPETQRERERLILEARYGKATSNNNFSLIGILFRVFSFRQF